MSSSTPKYQIPYVTPTDDIVDYPVHMQSQSQTIETLLDVVAGATGPTGPTGSAGPGVIVQGSVPTSGDLHPTGAGSAIGDMWITEDTGHGWVWNGTTWVDVGPIQGPTGPQGPDGPAGPPPTYLPPLTVPGPPPTDGNPGEIVIDSDGNGWFWNGSTWVSIGSVLGPTGPTGPTGANGVVKVQGYKTQTIETIVSGDGSDLNPFVVQADLRVAQTAELSVDPDDPTAVFPSATLWVDTDEIQADATATIENRPEIQALWNEIAKLRAEITSLRRAG